ncbi:hypothetical protein AMST5_03061 [freshwater sediment metagenome]|uniref:Uncharacterized protein n=1 Tax=freshwater sediment metagenome TaxID=556182 RepID=A0AA48M162_9ZZZZ
MEISRINRLIGQALTVCKRNRAREVRLALRYLHKCKLAVAKGYPISAECYAAFALDYLRCA